MRYLSVCSGIEAATVAWHPLGWEPVAFSEVDAFPSAVLQHHYPSVPNLGDMTKFQEWPDADVDVLVGGTPCQSFSVAGLRKGLDDPRGSLMLVYLAIARRYRPRWVVWENVPGVLSADGGGAFGSLLGGLAELGYGFAYRVLDAQYFGVAQRRKRVFVVGCLGDWRRAAAVLFERESLSGHPAPRRTAGQVAPTVPARRSAGLGTDFDCDGGLIARQWPVDVAPTLNAAYGDKQGLEDQHALGGGGLFVPSPVFATDGQANAAFAENIALTLNATHEQPYIAAPVAGALTAKGPCAMGAPEVDAGHYVAHSLRADGFDASGALKVGGGKPGQGYPAVAFTTEQTPKWNADQALTLTQGSPTGGGHPQAVATHMAVRRLTPRECERLQGFPDDYTLIPFRNKPAADGNRYKALGNSMAVPVMHWIGKRIQMVEAL